MLLNLKPLNSFTIATMLGFSLLIFFCYILFNFPSATTSQIPIPKSQSQSQLQTPPQSDPFKNLLGAFKKWDLEVGCANFKQKHVGLVKRDVKLSSLQVGVGVGEDQCGELKMDHVGVLVKGWTWIPDNLDNLYSCRCGLSCLWTKSSVMVDKPDAVFFETTTPPFRRRTGDPLRVYMDLEAGRKKSGFEDIFISYHAKDDVQSTYAGGLFHNNRNYHLSPSKNNDTLVYWSSSRCLPQRNQLAKRILSLLPHHSFGKCLNNMGGLDMALSLYPECAKDPNASPQWWDHLHCAMSHYKFVLAIENTYTESYVTEKLFYALDSGAVPIYFGAPNVMDFVPPHSIIDGTKFKSMEELADYVKALANDPVAYAEYHAWRRCGVLGNYGLTRAASLDTLPCRLCEAVSRRGGRDATGF
ncbi:putative glycoprotein 3-alpha-L-fucosyltransferase [Helianthus annuus]|uniref:Fucosyltransferase n=1 Tax=Helianthus annuus TaxID=4232 RepID=A0A251T8G3_HELAN|nr:alpha-(1,4)-fucosyltransferase [Helianthus annuus]KAF5780408.1 putative glycoprotein 3-alpha-L-fucosyltransferase [Helianthus annuus]KAJ0500229.1 putative glycoprotein 3-alpha-L-fucosyltransferase [Helianthus annuus]KAJ0516061.1 putative glycoprotein 3-alpha-L-fucosyltransferase [Helianthus annuus]KAJ0684078.1 putative glycoprotein 3-alpha-L-fucosyltransferase [Helianthus annuus]KAJ0688038.1 putative glycoprotein 3-alpha-L-fucosyltransferase [Helianthus annuus]